MTATVNNGTTVSVSATLPATYDDTGYGVPTFTTLGEVVDIGEIAKAFSVVAHQALERDYPEKYKDTYDVGNVSMTIAKVTSDAGQVILAAALASDASYSFKVTLPSTDIAYFTGKVLKAGIGAISSGSVTTIALDIAIDPQSVFET